MTWCHARMPCQSHDCKCIGTCFAQACEERVLEGLNVQFRGGWNLTGDVSGVFSPRQNFWLALCIHSELNLWGSDRPISGNGVISR